MWQKQSKGISYVYTKKFVSLLTGLCVGGLLLVGCGAGSIATSSPGSSMQAPVRQNSGNNNGSTSLTAGQKTGGSGQYGPQYLSKSLQVSMQVQDTRQAAGDLQQWMSASDPQATSDGTDYEQVGDNQYNVTLTFLVDADHYAQVGTYLRDYAGQKGRTLMSMRENVQDVTNDYVDAQSTLTNLQAEQQRLLGFMNQAQNLNDAVNIEQQLTQVEGQINSIEAHLNALKGQVAFYTVTISLQPTSSAPPTTFTPSTWSVVPIWQGAWSAVVSVWQVLAALLVWLAAFSVYIVPALVILWLVRKRAWRWSRLARVMPGVAVPGPQPKDGEAD